MTGHAGTLVTSMCLDLLTLFRKEKSFLSVPANRKKLVGQRRRRKKANSEGRGERDL